jgi:hypothetical protein
MNTGFRQLPNLEAYTGCYISSIHILGFGKSLTPTIIAYAENFDAWLYIHTIGFREGCTPVVDKIIAVEKKECNNIQSLIDCVQQHKSSKIHTIKVNEYLPDRMLADDVSTLSVDLFAWMGFFDQVCGELLYSKKLMFKNVDIGLFDYQFLTYEHWSACYKYHVDS